jgi:hypothetical protein
MKRTVSSLTLAVVSCLGVIGLGVLLSVRAFAQQGPGAQGISASAVEQMVATAAMKRSFTRAEQKMDSNLVFAAKAARGQLAGTRVDGIASATGADLGSYVPVDIYGNVSAGLLASIASVGGVATDPSAQWGMIRVSLPLGAIETIAAHDDVRSIQSAAEAITNVGALTSHGYVTHAANHVVKTGIDGTGATVGVLSDSASPACVAALIATGDLPPNTFVLPGQQGPLSGFDEGCAMMEIVHDNGPRSQPNLRDGVQWGCQLRQQHPRAAGGWCQCHRGRRHLLQ